MSKGQKASNETVRHFWEANPVAAAAVSAEPGTQQFYQQFDALREADDCEPYEFSNAIHGYSTSKGLRVLDVGCGNAYVLSRYAKFGAEVCGVDLTEKAIALSRRRFELAGLDGQFEQINGIHLPFPDDYFDIVCSMGVLHHIEDPNPTVAEIYRVLKPGGKLIAMLYYRYSYKTVVLMRLKRLLDPRYRGMSQQDALNFNDGEYCPLALVYSKGESRRLFGAFEGHRFRLNQLTWRQLFLFPPVVRFANRWLPPASESWPARLMGWNLYIDARKPGEKQ